VGIAGRDSGFSLVEVLVTVAIIALLTAVALPQYIAYRAQAVDAQMKDDLKSAALAMESYFSDKKSIRRASRRLSGPVSIRPKAWN